MIISLVAAVDQRGGIGRANRLPWHLSDDLKHFRRLTMGHHALMGRTRASGSELENLSSTQVTFPSLASKGK